MVTYGSIRVPEAPREKRNLKVVPEGNIESK